MNKIRFFKYYYYGSKPVPITISRTKSMIVEPYSFFTIPEDAQGELGKVTKQGNVRFVSIVANPTIEPKNIMPKIPQVNTPLNGEPEKREPLKIIIKSNVKPFPKIETQSNGMLKKERVSQMEDLELAVKPRVLVQESEPVNIEPTKEIIVSSEIKRSVNELKTKNIDKNKEYNEEKIVEKEIVDIENIDKNELIDEKENIDIDNGIEKRENTNDDDDSVKKDAKVEVEGGKIAVVKKLTTLKNKRKRSVHNK